MKTIKHRRSFDSEAVHAAHPSNHDPYGAHVMPIYQSSTFVFDNVEDGRRLFAHEAGGASHTYTRIANPTVQKLEEVLARLEGYDLFDDKKIEALAFGSGMAAISTALIALGLGKRIIAQRALYGCTSQFLTEEAPKMNMPVTLIDPTDLDELETTLRNNPDTGVVYLESIANPTMELCDIERIAEIAHTYHALVLVDNTFATPYHIRPLNLGADMVLHSTTKYLSGHGTIVGGALVARDSLLEEMDLGTYRKNLGGIESPFDAWLTLNGLKTFSLRMERHSENAMEVACYLEQHQLVENVFYPGLENHPQHQLASEVMEGGFGGMLSFELRGGYTAGVHLMEHVELCSLAVSLGNVDSLIQHPASMTHAVMDPEVRRAAGITDGLVRLSVGLEKVDDIISDLDQAMLF